MFSTEFLAYLVYGALGWCAVTGVILIIMLLKEWRKGNIW
ncbi:hypothetical protein SAMN05216326_11011 [Nitrosomonas marina]|uniref:Uncharacterized protein n=1 Tax=Nitrosomonas marina TaxID=917 RepID=A0A1I0BAF2_9PROT|nr:hypothetical protein SAMN05216325_10574 [Nitrosomonas marina]SET03767.1 hypothetical protein SAMN05216326_11011 [Nitrosomonas marina]